jgi:hydroxymethylpyrimidine pyrophosphatase-like HAD family hydrolase
MTLYLSDLDGTLLTSGQRLTPFTIRVINQFIESGGIFSYATARSWVTASKVTAGLNLTHPSVCYNGAFIFGSGGDIRLSRFFTPEKKKDIINTSYICSKCITWLTSLHSAIVLVWL